MSDIEKQISELLDPDNMPKKIELPAVVDSNGRANPNIRDMGRLPLIIQLAQLGQAVKTRKAIESLARYSSYVGDLDPYTLQATENRKDLQAAFPWVSAFFINDGPSPVYVAINYPHKPIRMLAGETRTVDHKGAKVRIERIWYWCDVGNTAILRMECYF
jgi:hypothetical protein